MKFPCKVKGKSNFHHETKRRSRGGVGDGHDFEKVIFQSTTRQQDLLLVVVGASKFKFLLEDVWPTVLFTTRPRDVHVMGWGTVRI